MQTLLRALIIDDETPARELLRALLAPQPNVEVVGEASSVSTAATLCGDLQPNLIFLDVQMPGATAFLSWGNFAIPIEAGKELWQRTKAILISRYTESNLLSAVVASQETTTEPLAGEAGEQSGAFSGKFFIRLVALSITRQVRPQSIQE